MKLFIALAGVVVLLSGARIMGLPTIVYYWQRLPTNARLLYLAGYHNSGLSYHSTTALKGETPSKKKSAAAKTGRQSGNRQKQSVSQ